MAKLPGPIKGNITKMFKKGMLLPEIKKAIEPVFPKITIQRIKTVLRSHFMELCDELWSEAVKLKAGNVCVISKKPGTLNSHHLIGRLNYKFRWDIDNGVCLGAYRHTLANNLAAHGSTDATLRFRYWMMNHQRSQWIQFQDNMDDHETIKVDVYYLLETAKRLEAEIEALRDKPKGDILARKKV